MKVKWCQIMLGATSFLHALYSTHMTHQEFDALVAEEYAKVPQKYATRLNNVALLIEDAPSLDVRQEEGLRPEETLLGLYQGVPLTERGDHYGIGVTVPDTITLYREPILAASAPDVGSVRMTIRETLWHEIGHYFGLDEEAIERREGEGSNTYQ